MDPFMEDCSDTEYYDSESDTASELQFFDRSKIMISIYNNAQNNHGILLTNNNEIQQYRRRFSELKEKNHKNINDIWNQLCVWIPAVGYLPLIHLNNRFITNILSEKRVIHCDSDSAESTTNKSHISKVKPVKNEKSSAEIHLKKKLKKQKQREKKLENKKQMESSTLNKKKDHSNNSTPKHRKNSVKSSDKLLQKQNNKTSENETEDDTISISSADVLTDNDSENVPTFVEEDIKHKTDYDKNATNIFNTPSTSIDYPIVNSENEDGQEFILSSKKRKKTALIKDKNLTSEKYAKYGIIMILDNKLEKALEYLTTGIQIYGNDSRYYLLRCICYLKMQSYYNALADAKFVIRNGKMEKHVFIAHVRAGQCLYALQKYSIAEMYYKEALRINPGSYYVHREMLRVKVAHITSMGFNEIDALLALEKHQNHAQAIDYLLNGGDVTNHTKTENDADISLDDFNLIYSSDDDEFSNTMEIRNRILNNTVVHSISAVSDNKNNGLKTVAKPSGTNIAARIKIKPRNGNTDQQNKETTVWVGNLNPRITEEMLKKKFEVFGKVISIYRTQSSYGFINFAKAEDARQVLSQTSIMLNGIKLLIRSRK